MYLLIDIDYKGKKERLLGRFRSLRSVGEYLGSPVKVSKADLMTMSSRFGGLVVREELGKNTIVRATVLKYWPS